MSNLAFSVLDYDFTDTSAPETPTFVVGERKAAVIRYVGPSSAYRVEVQRKLPGRNDFVPMHAADGQVFVDGSSNTVSVLFVPGTYRLVLAPGSVVFPGDRARVTVDVENAVDVRDRVLTSGGGSSVVWPVYINQYGVSPGRAFWDVYTYENPAPFPTVATNPFLANTNPAAVGSLISFRFVADTIDAYDTNAFPASIRFPVFDGQAFASPQRIGKADMWQAPAMNLPWAGLPANYFGAFNFFTLVLVQSRCRFSTDRIRLENF